MDSSPLPAGALVRFQIIARAPAGVKHNYRYVLYPDGRIVVRRRQQSDVDGNSTPTLRTKSTRISSSTAQRVEARLRAARFLKQRSHHAPTCEDGAIYVVTARLDGRVHRVIYECAYPPFVELLGSIGQHVP